MKFSIIIPTYNRADFIGKAIESVIAQTFSDWELIVVNDASTDNTLDVIAQYKDERVKVLSNEINKERSYSRNKGIAASHGEYICLLDSDDYFLPNHLEALNDAIEKADNRIAFFYTATKQYNTLQGVFIPIERNEFVNPVETAIGVHIPVITVAIHRSVFEKFKFDLNLRINEDVYLFAQIATAYPLHFVNTVTVVWVIHGNNTIDQERDYLTPQLVATDIIFNDAAIKPHVSSSFKHWRYIDLYAQLIYFHATRKEFTKAWGYWFKSLGCQFFDKRNKVGLLNIIYNYTWGKRVKNLVLKIKNW